MRITSRWGLWMLCAICVLSAVSLAQDRGKASVTINGSAITMDYGRPELKGRDMLAQLPPGQDWRFGKDAATSIKSGADLNFGSVTVPKGEYTLRLKRVSENAFQLIFNKQVGQWGTEHDPKQDLYEVPLKSSALKQPVEIFTVELKAASGNKGTLLCTWGSTALSADFTVK